MSVTSLVQTDFYKTNHYKMYPTGTTKIYSNLTPRKSRIKGIDSIVVFGIQYFLLEYLAIQWHENFFGKPKEKVIAKYKRMMDATVGKDAISMEHIEALHKLGYLPLHIKALPEGTLCPIGVPCVTITNTIDHAYWLVNYLETIFSCCVWQPITSATIAHQYRKLLNKFAIETTGSTEGVQWQGHDFSMRGMSSLESACTSGAGHLLSFTGTDTIPAISFLEEYYLADVTKELVGASVPATEHSVMCMGSKDGEIETFERLLNLYPTGILSVVSDTWDLWKVCTEFLPKLKDKILARDGKLVIRPDSGDPVDIICGTIPGNIEEVSEIDDLLLNKGKLFKYKGITYEPLTEEIEKLYLDYGREQTTLWENGIEDFYREIKLNNSPESKGVIELLWDVFGGTVNEQGYKVLDSHIGAIYGDSITLERAEQICERLKEKGFASTNIVFGIGSYTYQMNTRDTFGFAIKATYGEINGEALEIFKDPITDDGTKKSKKGLLRVTYAETDNPEEKYLVVDDQCTWAEEQAGLLETVFLDGTLPNIQSLSTIRERLNKTL